MMSHTFTSVRKKRTCLPLCARAGTIIFHSYLIFFFFFLPFYLTRHALISSFCKIFSQFHKCLVISDCVIQCVPHTLLTITVWHTNKTVSSLLSLTQLPSQFVIDWLSAALVSSCTILTQHCFTLYTFCTTSVSTSTFLYPGVITITWGWVQWEEPLFVLAAIITFQHSL